MNLNNSIEKINIEPIINNAPIIPLDNNPTNITVAMKNEFLFFQNLREKLNLNIFNTLMKFVFLYIECIISSHELFNLSKDFFSDESSFTIFRDIMYSRENSRRKSTFSFKALGDIDFSSNNFISSINLNNKNMNLKFNFYINKDCERCMSYTKLPKNFPVMKNSNGNEICKKNLNKIWFSVPHGSEHYTFTNMRKNIYEEALFKVNKN